MADTISGGYIVRDANGQVLAYIYSRDTDVEARQAEVLTKDEARRNERRAIGKKQRDTPNWPVLANAISRTLCIKGLQSDFLVWPFGASRE
jgi:hypothetical protein